MTITPNNQQVIAQVLCQLLHESKDARIRAKAALSLGKLGMESTIPNLCQAATQDPDPKVKESAIDALVLIAKPELLTTESAKNQPTFNIGQVSNLNTGDVNIQGDMVGKQYNYTFPDPKQSKAVNAVALLLQDIRQQYPKASDTEVLNIIQHGFEIMQQNNLPKWRAWIDLFSLVFAGGIEAIKVIAPALGIPIEVGKRLYEIYERNRKQLPDS